MTDIVERLRDWANDPVGRNPAKAPCAEAADEIERLRAALLEIFDHECRTSGKSFIACTARDALWPGTALAGEKKDE